MLRGEHMHALWRDAEDFGSLRSCYEVGPDRHCVVLVKQVLADGVSPDNGLPAPPALVEELMRGETLTLDHLSRPAFKSLARQARGDADQIQAEGWQVSFCEAMRLSRRHDEFVGRSPGPP